jgi:uncharacterized protein (TIGR03435 family)
MADVSDVELLQDYVRGGSDDAFAELVRRHLSLVYSTAIRHVGIAAHAEEITQAVFVVLARKAGTLRPNTILEGWLYETTRLTALSFQRGERRRQFREQEAYMQSTLPEHDNVAFWNRLAPLLDEAMARLGKKDREAVVLRFFKEKSLNEVAAAMDTTEAAAQSRVYRATEKLRKFFSKRGVSSTSAVLAGAISANSVQAAPVTLAKSVTAVAIAKGATASGSTLTIIKGALKTMAWTKAKTAIAVGVGVLFVGGLTTITVKKLDASYHAYYNSWRTLGLNSAIVDQTAPQVRILPTKFAGTGGALSENNNFTKWGGLNVPVSTIAYVAYECSPARVVMTVPPSKDRYDFISSLDQGSYEGLRRELRKTLGFVGRRETREVDVLLLTVKTPNASGLKPPIIGRTDDYSQFGRYLAQDRPLSSDTPPYVGLARFLEEAFQVPVIDQTGLTQHFSIDLQWPKQPTRAGALKAVKQAMLDQLGLELVASRKPVEMLVMEKTKP